MDKNKLHLIPQPIIDCAENLISAHQDHIRDTYILRLEAIRDYCDYAIKSSSNTKPFNLSLKKKSTHRQ